MHKRSQNTHTPPRASVFSAVRNSSHGTESQFPLSWTTVVMSDLFVPVLRKNTENNRNVLTISAQEGLINQLEYYNHQYASADTSCYTLLLKGEFAYNKSYSSECPFGAIKRLDRYERGVVSPLYLCFAPKDGVNTDFFVFYFNSGMLNRSLYGIVQEGARNHGLLNISSEGFFASKLILPPLSEQRRIASILSTADRVIAGKERLLEAKRTRKRALMQKLLNPGTNGDSAFSRVGAGGMRKEGRISHVESVKMIIPVNEWEWKRLEEIATITSGSTPSRQHPEYWNGGIPWVTTGELATSPILKTVETISEVGREKASLRKYAKGTLLMAMYGQGKTRGTVSILGIDATINQACAAISTQSNDSMFLFYQLQYRYESIRRLSNVGSQENLNAEIIASISIPLPSLETQRRIAAILAAADREIDGLAHEIDAWKEKRKALSQLLLSGKVRV